MKEMFITTLLIIMVMHAMASLEKKHSTLNTQLEYYVFPRRMENDDYFLSQTLLGASSFNDCIMKCETFAEKPCQSISVNISDIGVTCRYFDYRASRIAISTNNQNFYITKRSQKKVCEDKCKDACGECQCLNACFFADMEGPRKYMCDCTRVAGTRTSCVEHASSARFVDRARYLVNPDNSANDIVVQCQKLDRDFIGKDVTYEPFLSGYYLSYVDHVGQLANSQEDCANYCYSLIESGKLKYNGWTFIPTSYYCYCHTKAGNLYPDSWVYHSTIATLASNKVSVLATPHDSIVFLARGDDSQKLIWSTRSFDDYAEGFTHSQNTWLGLENAARITAQATFDLRVDVSSTFLIDVVTTYYRDVKIVHNGAAYVITFASFHVADGVRSFENLRSEQLVSGTEFAKCPDNGWWFCYGSSPTRPTFKFFFGQVRTIDAIGIYLVYV